jgi:hypothetical protein
MSSRSIAALPLEIEAPASAQVFPFSAEIHESAAGVDHLVLNDPGFARPMPLMVSTGRLRHG